MIHFIFGLPGTGKTELLTQNILRDVAQGHPTLLLVPEQQTVEVERAMLRLLPPSAQLNFEVVNFSRLANKLFRLYGGLSYHHMTPGLRHLLMWRTLKELDGLLAEYHRNVSSDASLPSRMLAQIGEFKAYNVAPAALERAAGRLPDDSALKNKLGDLSLIYAAYEGLVGESFDMGENDLKQLAELLERHHFFRGYHIYIDSFTSFTAEEHRILKHILATAEEVFLAFAADSPYSDAMELSVITDTAKRLMVEAGDKADIITKNTFHRFTSPELIRVASRLWRFGVTGKELAPIPQAEQGAVSLIRCATPYAEAEAATNLISSLLARGYHRREIAIIARDAEAYRGIIDAALDKAGISYFLSQKVELETKPPISMMLSALNIKLRGWRQTDVIAYLKSGIPDIPASDIDIFQNYVTAWSINGSRFYGEDWVMNPEGYSAPFSERGRLILATANRVRQATTAPLLSLFAALDAAENVRQLCEAMMDFLRLIGVDRRMKANAKRALAAGDRKQAAEDAATFRAICQVFSDIVAVMGDETMTVEEFSAALRPVFANTDIGTIPTAADQVMIGSASMLRVSGVRCAILLGLCDGQFPARVGERGFLSDTDRHTLDSLGISLSGDTSSGAAEELFYCYRAMTLPSERLVLMYHDTDATGKTATFPSSAFRRVTELLPHLSVEQYGEGDQRLWSKALAMEALPSLRGTPYHAPLCHVLSEDPYYATLVTRGRRRVENINCRVSPECADAIFGRHMTLTQSRLDRYVSCHLSYYGRYVLGLMENGRADFRLSDSGTLIHRILEVFMKAVTDEEGLRRDVEFEDIRRLVIRETERYLAELSGSTRPGARLRYLFKRLSRLALSVAVALYEEFRDSEFVPRLFEAAIGEGRRAVVPSPTLSLSDGSTVDIYGVIDRVDIFKKDGRVYVKVVDYKTGTKKFSLEDIKEGLNTQLLLYLFAVCRTPSPALRSALGCGAEDVIVPAGAMYISTAISKVSLAKETDELTALRLAADKLERSGLLLDDPTVLDAISHERRKDMLLGTTFDKDDNPKGKALIKETQLQMLERQLHDTIRTVALEMRSGNAATCMLSGDTTPCAYCKLKLLCRVGTRPGEGIE